MRTDNYMLGPGSFYMTDAAGKTFMESPAYDISHNIPLSADAEVDYNFEFRTPLAQEFTADCCIVDTGLLKHISEQPKGFCMEYVTNVQVQVRRHRKKRINKKWLKRYGYKTVKCRVRFNCEELSMNWDDGCCSFNINASEVSYI